MTTLDIPLQSADQVLPGPTGKIAASLSWNWLGVVPFFAFSFLFLIAPMLYLIVGAFQDSTGAFTLANIAGLAEPNIAASYWLSVSPRTLPVSRLPSPSSPHSAGSAC